MDSPRPLPLDWRDKLTLGDLEWCGCDGNDAARDQGLDAARAAFSVVVGGKSGEGIEARRRSVLVLCTRWWCRRVQTQYRLLHPLPLGSHGIRVSIRTHRRACVW